MKTLRQLFILSICLTTWETIMAQDTYIVADNGVNMISCEDTTMTLEDIYLQRGIRDLDDPSEDASDYQIWRIQGSVITEDEITGPFKYSDYSSVFVQKRNTAFNGHNGVQIFLSIVNAPDHLFAEDTLKYVVEQGATVNIVQDFFDQFHVWSSGLDEEPLQERILFTDMADNIEQPIADVPSWAIVGEGFYRIRTYAAICGPSDLLWDTVYIQVEENACHSIALKNMPSVCREEILDITPYVYVDGHVATPAELSDFTFLDKSEVLNSSAPGTPIADPTTIDIATMFDETTNMLYPRIEMNYQPNITVGTCSAYSYLLDTKVPTKFAITDALFIHDNGGRQKVFMIEGTYYSFNDVFHKNVLNKLYLDYYDVFDGTVFDYYTDEELLNAVPGPDLSPGDYYVKASNTDCSGDESVFTIHVVNRDFDIVWNSEQNLGTGYYTFTAPDYPGASYGWNVWGGSIVSGVGTNQIRVYFSENASPGVFAQCVITLPAGRTSDGSTMGSAVYLINTGEDGALEEIPAGTVTSNEPAVVADDLECLVYPNPSQGSFALSGEGTYHLKVYNALGQLVYEQTDYQAHAPLRLESKGIHTLVLIRGERTRTVKAVLK